MRVGCKPRAGAIGASCARLALAALVAGCSGLGTEERPEQPEQPPESVAPLIEEAERLRAQGEYEGAIAAYEQALARTPWNDRIRLAVAATYAERGAQAHADGELGPAEADLRAALEVAPENPQVRRNLALLLTERAALDMDPERAQARRAEAEELAPGITLGSPVPDAGLERRLDLAFELVERGQLEAGIERLEALHESYPGNPEVSRLLAQALVRWADQLGERQNHVATARALDRAVEVYASLPGCAAPEWSDCELDDARLAHHNRIVAWVNSGRPRSARRALEDAARIGLEFPEFDAALRREEGH